MSRERLINLTSEQLVDKIAEHARLAIEISGDLHRPMGSAFAHLTWIRRLDRLHQERFGVSAASLVAEENQRGKSKQKDE